MGIARLPSIWGFVAITKGTLFLAKVNNHILPFNVSYRFYMLTLKLATFFFLTRGLFIYFFLFVHPAGNWSSWAWGQIETTVATYAAAVATPDA